MGRSMPGGGRAVSYGTRPFQLSKPARLAGSWLAWFAAAVAALLVVCAVVSVAISAFRWVHYNQLRASAGRLYCADVPDGVDRFSSCRDYACLEQKAAELDGNSEALIKYAVRCDRVLDRRRE